MTITAKPNTGNIATLDEQQRNTALAAALTGPVRLLGDTASLAQVLGDSIEARVSDEPGSDAVTLVARSSIGSALDEALVDELVAHATAGGAWALDTVDHDRSARDRLTRATAEVTVIVQCDLIGSLLAAEHATLDGSVVLGDGQAVAIGPHARRVVLFGGVEGARELDVQAQALLFPHDAEEIARLRIAVNELSLTNRRLSEGRLGVHDAAAARAASAVSELARVRAETSELHAELESARFHAKQNDELFQDARLQLFAATTRIAQLETELSRHHVEPRLFARRILAGARNRLRPR